MYTENGGKLTSNDFYKDENSRDEISREFVSGLVSLTPFEKINKSFPQLGFFNAFLQYQFSYSKKMIVKLFSVIKLIKFHIICNKVYFCILCNNL